MTDFANSLSEGKAGEKSESAADFVLMSSSTMDAEARAEVDYQVATAKQYPRDLHQVLKNIEFLATQDQETAESCFYAIKRDNKTITGATVRLAEIISSCWGNIRSQAKIIANDGRTIVAQGTCWDLESNVAYSVEVRRKITNSLGNTYSEDMQIVSANAACSVALRNAVFKVVPMAITRKIQERIKDVMLGDEESFEDVKQKALKHFIEQGIKKGDILKLLERERVEHITRDDVFILRGIATAIEQGDTTLKASFAPKKARAKGLSSKLAVEEQEDDDDLDEIVSENKVKLKEKPATKKTTTNKK